jgi:hypothetical protein
MGYELVGKVWGPVDFRAYLRTLDLGWVRGVTIHHTAAPNLEQRPHGFTARHMRNLQHYYQNQLGWSAGPHLFIDDDQIWGLSSLERPGTHARSFNRSHIGIEVLGNYDLKKEFESKRGKDCREMAAEATAAILAVTGLSVGAVNGHNDDPRTSKTCPGKYWKPPAWNQWLLVDVKDKIDPEGMEDRAGGRGEEEDVLEMDKAGIAKRLDAIGWQIKKIREDLGL